MHLESLDFLLILFVIIMAVRGFLSGFLRQVGTLVGFLLGMFLGSLLAPPLVAKISEPTIHASYVLTILVIVSIALALAFEGLANYIIGRLRRHKQRDILLANAYAGGLIGISFAVILCWLGSFFLVSFPASSFRTVADRSLVLRLIDEAMPPAPPVIAEVNHLIGAYGFPRVFIGEEPSPAPQVSVPVPAEIASVVAQNRQSVLKIEAFGCGGVSSGSGFVASTTTVVTNAHVIAGSERITASTGESTYHLTPLLFDPDLDLAILTTDKSIQEPVLSLYKGAVNRGTRAAALGYPGGGSLVATPAGVLQQIIATGRNIYDQGAIARRVYELQTTIERGDSGGPVLSLDGQVIGVIFGKSVSNPGIAYALTSNEVRSRLLESRSSNETVATGACLPE